MKNNKIILLTGASGFIGRHLIKPLNDLGFTVHALCRNPLQDTSAQWHAVDLFDRIAVRSLLQTLKPTHLLHAAWYAKPGDYWESPLNQDWLTMSLDLAHEFIAMGGKRFIGLGTCAEYDWAENITSPLSETYPLKPITLYGKSKLALFEQLTKMFAAEKISFVWARLFYPFGPFEARERLIPSICLSLLKDKLALCTSGEQVRDFIYVKEAAHMIAELIAAGCDGAFNIGSGQGIAVAEIANLIAKLMQKADLVKIGAIKQTKIEPAKIVADMRKTLQATEFKTDKNIADYLQMTINWWKKNQ